MPALLTESEYPLITGMLREKSISGEPAREAFGNVGGDSHWERVALFEKYLVILGANFPGVHWFGGGVVDSHRHQLVCRREDL